MTSAVLQPFLQVAERDLVLFNIGQVIASHVRWWVLLILRILVGPAFIVLAQFVPFIFRRHLSLLLQCLPNLQTAEDFAFSKDALAIYHEGLKAYAPFSLFRRQAEELLEDIDEQLDSLEFVGSHKDFLDKAVAHIERR